MMLNIKFILKLFIGILFLPLQSFTQVIDFDGNEYKTVKINSQIWMTENLNVSRFRNGDTIPEVKSSKDWAKAFKEGNPAWCYYKNENNYNKKYGKLYNWYAVIDPRGLAPEGWKIPSLEDFEILFNSLGGDEIAGFKMKSTSGWYNLKKDFGSNESGLSIEPFGYRDPYGSFSTWEYNVPESLARFWTSSGYGGIIDYAYHIKLGWRYDNAFKEYIKTKTGMSVRCVKE